MNTSERPGVPPFASRPRAVRGLLDALTRIERVHPSVAAADRVSSGLLARMIIVTEFVGAVLLAAILLASPDQIHILDTQFIVGGLVVMPVVYALNRLGRFRMAVWGYVITALVVFLVPTYVLGASAVSLAYGSIGLLIGGIFLSSRSFVLTTVSSVLWVGLMVLGNMNNPATEVPGNFIYYLSAWFLLILTSILISTFVTHLRATEAGRRHELESANARLKESEQMLEQRVKDRTQELEQARAVAEQARAAAEKSDQVKSQFLAAMSHELRTPLNAIINLSQFLRVGIFGPVNAQQADMSGKVVESANHLLELINDVLDISKIEAGSLQLFVEDGINMGTELESIRTIAETLLSGKPVRASFEIPSTLPTVRCDRLRIRQTVLNLVSNACKFTDEGHVTVRASAVQGNLRIEVEDTGPGIPPEDHEAIFEAFRQTDVGVRRGKGTGLGLAIARRLIEAHQGQLGLTSVVGKGTTFYVEFPICSDMLVPSISAQGNNDNARAS